MTGYRRFDSEIGELGLEATERGIARVWLPGDFPLGFASRPGSEAENALLDRAQRELEEYLRGERREFEVPLDGVHRSPGFAGEVQRGLRTVPYGETCGYGELADILQRPRAARAVGSACAKNPLPLLTPCHRIIRADGSPGLYGRGVSGGGGVELKRELIELERRAVSQAGWSRAG
ncbi:methylated-DNA--[protein]-cysteine S-methyltransferase [Gulosibacter sp. 10]|uniref:methylated-DNA--[protein]-cysteine S-methyltransferase n=1 Tax=Gulosibacter sp. 10 TaxID=1255570 RepID=UPI00097F61EB|nr:methylated-DNA--[protein]-cysteine S-methyltransferase [Gulosibacter sp. 10]SJM61637.1 Methylated-DNA--protein-cysteine methyltransferase [Gulosibacter sp. 10]